jgi:hypothetical protein
MGLTRSIAADNGYASQFKAAQFLRLAEEKGNKTLGNTWYVFRFHYQSSISMELVVTLAIVPGRAVGSTRPRHTAAVNVTLTAP